MKIGDEFLDTFAESQSRYAAEMEEAFPGHKTRLSIVRFPQGVLVAVYVRDVADPIAVIPISNDGWGKTMALVQDQEISWAGLTWPDFVEMQMKGKQK